MAIAETIALIEAALTAPGGRRLTQAPGQRGPALKSYLRHLPALLGVALLIGAIYVVQREFRHLRLEDIGAALEAYRPARWRSRSSGRSCPTSS